jgi:hypothetical protein
MLFEEAFDKAYAKTPAQLRPKGDKNIPKILTFLWSMIAIAQGELDDIAYIRDQDVVSVPLENLKEKKEVKKEKSGDDTDAEQTEVKKSKKDSASTKKNKPGAEAKKINDGAESDTATA